MLKDVNDRWTPAESSELYEVANWGNGYFSIGENGNLRVHPTGDPAASSDLKELIDRIRLRGLDTPVLIRFNNIIEHRLNALHSAFERAIAEHEYQGDYRCVYPIKVNQQRQVVEQIVKHGKKLGFGLEAGSKPELMAVIALTNNDVPVICNGFKDAEFIEMALIGQVLGRNILPVVEKYSELELILECAERLNVRPQIGMRVKLAARGAGRWQTSGGFRSKFGLTLSEITAAVEHLESLGMSDCFQLLHFHLGSQITNIRQIKSALIEAARIYTELKKRNTGLRYLDVGGGLGVDYDGSQTNFESSMNYSMQEYANDVIHHVQSVCDQAQVPHPDIISESGRAISAYHSVLIFDVLDTTSPTRNTQLCEVREDSPQPVLDLHATLADLSLRNVLESFHDAQQAFDMAINAFATGYMPLSDRCDAEILFWAICRKITRMTEEMDEIPEDLAGLDGLLADTYFCNFSLFQSLPDSWAVKQLFPIMPIHRLQEQPTRNAVIGDITCDSDGKVDRFVDRRDVRRTLPLHEPNGEPYYLGAFLVGAYQEILGDLHNLFGDTNTAHVSFSADGDLVLEQMFKGDTVADVLRYVRYEPSDLLQRFQTSIERAVQEGRINYQQAGSMVRFYETRLAGYTYLEPLRQLVAT